MMRIGFDNSVFNKTIDGMAYTCKKQFLHPGEIGGKNIQTEPKTLTEAWAYIQDPQNPKYHTEYDFIIFLCHDYDKTKQ